MEVRVPNRQGKLAPGMFARVNLELGQKDAMIVPSLAVLKQSGTNERYVMVHENGQARRIQVLIVNRYDDQLEIESAELQGGEELIYTGHTDLETGDPVEVVVE